MRFNGQWTGPLTLIVIVAITASSLLIWLGGLLLLWFILQFLGIATDFWVMTESLSTATAVAALLIAGYVAYRELDEVASTRHMEVADRLFEELNAQENIEARRWVYQNLPDDPHDGVSSLSPEGRAAVKRVLNSLDRIAFLTQAGWIPGEMVMPWMASMIIKSWHKLGPYVEFESARRGEPDYYASVRSLAERCRVWQEKKLPEFTVKWIDNAL